MIKRTFIDRSNTIFEGSNENYGLHPISMLNYGLEKSRVLIHFDINEIQEFINSCPEGSEIKHTLKMTNCGSIDFKNFDLHISSNDINGHKKRASSFYVYAFPIPNNGDNGYIDWDEGIGFDSKADNFISGEPSISNEGSNWFNRKSGLKWEKTGCIGVPEKNNIIAMQHFDHGNENLELDITNYINTLLSNEINEWSAHNDGLCLSIEPQFDSDVDDETIVEETKYVGFFNNKTNTFFAPVIESRCEESIQDNRYDFIIGKTNRLYLYVSTPDGFTDLDETPICTIEGISFEVKRFSQGIYYVEVNNGISLSSDVIYEDVWGIKLNGVYDEITQEFVPHSNKTYFSITPDTPREDKYEPSLSGINDDEILNNGEIRKVDVKYRVPYSTKYKTLNNTEYRLYSKDKNREIDIIDWDKINNAGSINYFTINTSELVSGKYFVDIRIKTKYEQRVFKEVLRFSKVNNVTKISH
jgi:hypothetical protein